MGAPRIEAACAGGFLLCEEFEWNKNYRAEKPVKTHL